MDLDDEIRLCINLSFDGLSPVWLIILLKFVKFITFDIIMEVKFHNQLDKSLLRQLILYNVYFDNKKTFLSYFEMLFFFQFPLEILWIS